MIWVKQVKCSECGAITDEDALLHADSPFAPDTQLVGCPQCKSVLDAVAELVCDEKGCTARAVAGTQTRCGYRTTRSRHRPR